MGQVFGRNGVAEPTYEVLYHRAADFSYEIRSYGTRFAAQTTYNGTDDQPFRALARYIGVFGTPENQGQETISMTAPVIKEGQGSGKPVPIAMTAPVIISGDASPSSSEKIMEFILPAEYDSMEKIPVPTNPQVTIRELPSATGAVHRYSGSMSDEAALEAATKLGEQLRDDGVDAATADYILSHYQYWGYNPPFTLPMFRRNEVWVPLDPAMVERLVASENGGSMAVPKN
jgi:hypothetical protein